MSDFRRLLPSEKALQKPDEDYQSLVEKCAYLEGANKALVAEHQLLSDSTPVRMARFLRRFTRGH